MLKERVRRQLYGVVLLGVVAALIAGVVLTYNQAFTPSVPVTVRADRAGLLMDPGAAVALRGINVGEVRSVGPDPGDGRHVLLHVTLDPDQVNHVPADVTAQIVAPTLFGAKYVQLDVPVASTAQRIQRNAAIPTTQVATETNDLLANLNTLLTHIDIAKVNSGLGGLSTALQGRGDRLGALLAQLNQYLLTLNPSVPTLNRDLAETGGVANIYADVTPDLVRILDNLSVTSDTLIDRQDALSDLLSSVITAGHDGQKLFDRNGDRLEDMLDALRPTSELLGGYSPMFPCLFASLNSLRVGMDKMVGYQYPAIHIFGSFLPGEQGYLNPRDLPKIGAKPPAPTCYGGPLKPADAPFPHVIFDDGWKGFVRSDAVTVAPGSPLPDPLPSPLRPPLAPAPDHLLDNLMPPGRQGGPK